MFALGGRGELWTLQLNFGISERWTKKIAELNAAGGPYDSQVILRPRQGLGEGRSINHPTLLGNPLKPAPANAVLILAALEKERCDLSCPVPDSAHVIGVASLATRIPTSMSTAGLATPAVPGNLPAWGNVTAGQVVATICNPWTGLFGSRQPRRERDKKVGLKILGTDEVQYFFIFLFLYFIL